MARKSTVDYVCQSCGSVYPKWQGKCDSCGEWNTIVEEKKSSTEFSNISNKKPVLLNNSSFELVLLFLV